MSGFAYWRPTTEPKRRQADNYASASPTAGVGPSEAGDAPPSPITPRQTRASLRAQVQPTPAPAESKTATPKPSPRKVVTVRTPHVVEASCAPGAVDVPNMDFSPFPTHFRTEPSPSKAPQSDPEPVEIPTLRTPLSEAKMRLTLGQTVEEITERDQEQQVDLVHGARGIRAPPMQLPSYRPLSRSSSRTAVTARQAACTSRASPAQARLL